MTNPRVFDNYAPVYEQTVNLSISASGESLQYFADLKARLMRREYQGRTGPGRILDFGCGTGSSTHAVLRLFPGSQVVGLDPSEESIAVATAANQSPGISYLHGGGHALPFADGSFDAAFTACVFHHIERGDHLHWASELCRVLKPGGALFIFEHNPLNPLTRRAVRDCPFDEGVELLDAQYTRGFLRDAGFVVAGTRFYFFFPRFLRALRPIERWLRGIPIGAQYFCIAGRP